mmetsp:Transcript_83789/g.236753  ORF Transcript_83789/g.236753 Transcript_83789/m.236753 type:complete len:3060 (-) Transcript_83789:463-9642(-)
MRTTAEGSLADPPKLPWLLSLLKTTAFLSGRLAGTMIIGDGNCHSLVEARCASSESSRKWVTSGLFARGLSNLNLQLVTRHGIPLSMDEAEADDASAVSAHAFDIARIESFLESLSSADNLGKKFCVWLRSGYCRFDAGYMMLSRQGLRSADGSKFEILEGGFLAALLLHTGLASQALLFADAQATDAPSTRRPPTQFMALWRVVSELSTWIWQERAKQRAEGAQRTCVFDRARSASLALLHFKSCDFAYWSLRHMPFRPDVKTKACGNASSNVPSLARQRWRRAQCTVRAAIRLRKSRQTPGAPGMLQILHSVPGAAREALRFVKDMTGSGLRNDGALSIFLLMVLENHRRAAARQHGLAAFHVLITSLKTQSLAVDVLHSLTPALRNPVSTAGHYLTCLEAVGVGPIGAVRDAFTTLYSELLNMIHVLAPGEDALRVGGVGTTNAHETIDSQLLLLLLDAWGLNFRQGDWPFIGSAGVLHTVHMLITRVEDHIAVAASEQPSGRGAKPAIPISRSRRNVSALMKQRERRLKQCVSAAWTLLRLIGSQLAALGLLHSYHFDPLKLEPPRLDTPPRDEAAVAEESSGKRVGPKQFQRQPFASVTCSWFGLLEPCFDVFRTELAQGLREIEKLGQTASADSEQHLETDKDKNDMQRPGHRRRCQEIIGAPRRFMNMEDGMQIPAEQLLANSKGPDFSITFWLCLTQDSTGKPRVILTRGHKHERWPVILLRDVDRRLEVAFGITNMGTLCERLTSKEPVPLHKWTHIGLVSEGNKLRLYINGALDSPRNNCGVPHRANRHPLYIGKVPDGCVRLDGIRGGVEGSLAHLRYYTRALSPIHVRIVCDQGPPETIKVKDRRVYQMCSLLHLCANSSHGQAHLSQPAWVELLFQLLVHGTLRVQQAVTRILHLVLPVVRPDRMLLRTPTFSSTDDQGGVPAPASTASPRTDAGIVEATEPTYEQLPTEPTEPLPVDPAEPLPVEPAEPPPVEPAEPLPDEPAVSLPALGPADPTRTVPFASYLLRVIGLALWRTRLAEKTAEKNDAEVSAVVTLDLIPRNIRSCCVTTHQHQSLPKAPGSGVSAEAAAGIPSGTPPPQRDISTETLSEVSVLASELVGLMQRMVSCTTWGESTALALRTALVRLNAGLCTDKRAGAAPAGPDMDTMVSGLAALCILGGHSDGLRAGAQVAMTHTDMTATVVAYDEAAALAHVVMREVSSASVGGPTPVPGKSTTKPVRISAEELFVQGGIPESVHNWNMLFSDYATALFEDTILPLIENLFDQSSRETDSMFEPAGGSASRKQDGVSADQLDKGAVPCDALTLFRVQCQSRCAKIVGAMCMRSKWVNVLVQRPQALQKIMCLAVQTDGAPQFMTLDETEVRAVVVRRRLFQLMGRRKHLLGGEEASLPGAASKAAPADAGGVVLEAVDGMDTAHHIDAGYEDEASTAVGGGADPDSPRLAPPSERVEQLVVMGFPEEWCMIALRENGNDVASASTWIVDNLDTLTTMNASHDGQSLHHSDDGKTRRTTAGSADGTSAANSRFRHDEDSREFDSQHESDSEASSECGDQPRQGGFGDYGKYDGEKAQDNSLLSNIDVLLHENDRFDEEQAAAVYAENYFPGDPGNLPGSSYHGASSYGYGCGIGYGGDAGLATFRPKTIAAEIAGLGLSQLVEANLQTESSLAILHARATVLRILHSWPRESPRSLASVSPPSLVVQLLKVTALRGCQIPVSVPELQAATLDTGLEAVSGQLGARPGRPIPLGASPPNATTVLRPVLVQMVQDDMVHNGEALTTALVSAALDDLEAAAFIDVFADTPWSARSLCVSDSQAMLQPNVELAWWLLDLLLSLQCPLVLNGNTFFRLSNCLRSANMPVKEIVMRALTRILVSWCDTLQQRRTLSNAGESSGEFTTGAAPGATVIDELLHKSVPLAKLQCAAVRRIASEQRQERIFFSKYVHAMVELLVTVMKLEELLSSSLPALAGVGPGEAAGGDAAAQSTPRPSAPQLILATESSLSLGWLPAQSVHGAAAAASVRYQLEMASQLPGETGMGAYRTVFTGMSTHYQVAHLSPSRVYRFRVRALMSGRSPSAWSPEVTLETSHGVAFCFDRTNSGPAIFVNGDGLQATYGSNESWKTVVGSVPFMCGRNHWELKIDNSSTPYLFIGVAGRQADLTTFLGGDDFGWGYIGDRALYHKRTKIKVYGERFGQGDVIGVTLDMDRGTLSFSKNGLDLGVAFDGLGGELYPAVAFYNQGQQVSLLPSTFSCPGAGVVIADSPMSVSIQNAVELSEVMGSMKCRRPLPEPAVRQMHQAYTEWCNNTTIRYMTRAGYEHQFDTSVEACSPFGLNAWERVRTPRGNATVIGVADRQLWLHVDGEGGAWFFGSEEIAEGRGLGYFTFGGTRVTPMAPSLMSVGAAAGAGIIAAESKDDEGNLQESKGEDGVGGDPHQPVAPGTEFRDFCASADCPAWTVEMDALLVTAINEHAEKHEISPWNVPPAAIAGLVPTMQKRLRKIAGAPAWSSVAEQRAAVLGRVAVLRYFNALLAKVLPFIGVDDGLQVSSRPSLQASLWGEPREEQGLSVNPHPSVFAEARLEHSLGSGLGLAPLLCALRSSVFLSTKRRMMQLAVDRTMTHAKKAEDDYDYPEDLPQVLLNRPKAAASRTRRDPETRLSLSLFGQLFDELHFMEPALLRMGYTHPMDDGQERTFKVKFEGEGVDDYGGPYREIFSQVAAELQSIEQVLRPETRSARKAADACILPLLRPTPNSNTDDAVGSDKFIVQPRLTRHLYLEMYNFLGQIIGIALRSKVTMKIDVPSIFWKAMVGQPVEESDLESFDQATMTMISHIRKLNRDGNEEALEAALSGLAWTARLSGGEEVELTAGGIARAVNPADAAAYVKALGHARLHESDKALFAIRDGLASIIPASVLPLLTWEELERYVCGQKEIDLELLKANTEYDDDVSPNDEHVVRLWRVLESFDHDERSAFLRFVWARSRLPASSAFNQKFKLQSAVGEGPKNSPDTFLPKAHTCFFSLNLPRYRYAIYNCIEMDADFRLADNEMTGWADEADYEE